MMLYITIDVNVNKDDVIYDVLWCLMGVFLCVSSVI